MSDRFELQIGGLGFELAVPSGHRLVERDTVYAPFLARGLPAARDRIAVSLTLDPAPEPSELEVLFDTEETWVAFGDGRDVLLRMRSTGGSRGYLWWVRLVGARAGEVFEEVLIHCGERLIERRGAVVELTNPLHYPLDQLLMMFALPSQPGALIHAAGLARRGRGVFCAGVSGAGKTTFMRLCAERSDLEGLSDDRVIVRRVAGDLRLFGTPWAGEGRVAANRSVDLAAVAFLHKAENNELRSIGPVEALTQLLATASILWFDRQRVVKAMAFCESLVTNLPCYELHFRPDTDVVELLDELI